MNMVHRSEHCRSKQTRDQTIKYFVRYQGENGVEEREISLSVTFVLERCRFLSRKMAYESNLEFLDIYQWPFQSLKFEQLVDALDLLGAIRHPATRKSQPPSQLLDIVVAALRFLPIYSYMEIREGLEFCDKAFARYLEKMAKGPTIKAMNADEKDLLVAIMDAACFEQLQNCKEPASRMAQILTESFLFDLGLTARNVVDLADAVTLAGDGEALADIGFSFQGEFMNHDDKTRLFITMRGITMTRGYRHFVIRGSRIYDGRCFARKTKKGLEFSSERKILGCGDSTLTDGFCVEGVDGGYIRHLCITRCNVNHEWIIVGRGNRKQPGSEQLKEGTADEGTADVELFRAEDSHLEPLPPYKGWRGTTTATASCMPRVIRYRNALIEHSEHKTTRIPTDWARTIRGTIWDLYQGSIHLGWQPRVVCVSFGGEEIVDESSSIWMG